MGGKLCQNAPIALASASPRRRELVASLGLEFTTEPANIDESAIHISDPRKLVKELSKLKAEATLAGDRCVIGSDTVVFARGKLYGKPHTEENARRMIAELQGKWHKVYTGVTTIYGGDERTFCVKSKVKFKRMSEAEIARYVAEKQPLDKAGAYGIQDGDVVEKYRGSYTNIVGLPLEKLTKILRRIGVAYGND